MKNMIFNKLINSIEYILFILFFAFSVSCNDPNIYIQEGTRGCTNTQADNYNVLATLDDGSCITVNKKQNSIFVKFTATWCGPCGSYGMNLFSEKTAQHNGKILGFTVQYNDALTNPNNIGLMNEFVQHMSPPNGTLSTPSFGVNNQYYAQNIAAFDSEINTNFNKSPNVGVGLNWTRGAGKNNGKINMNILGKWFKPISGQYNITVLVIGKKIIAPQKIDDSYIANFEHKNVLLGSITQGGLYGESFYNGSTEINQLTEWKKVVQLDPTWDINNIYFGIIIWKKTGNTWVFENSNIN
jgi:hypothetical protein